MNKPGRAAKIMKARMTVVLYLALALGLAACGGSTASVAPDEQAAPPEEDTSEYLIGPGDTLQVYVWDNPELSVTVPVRPDGMITIPLVEDMEAFRKTPSELARNIETELSEYIRSPQVNIIVTNFRGTYRKQIRVVGQAVSPQSLSYQSGMTLLDVVIEVGGAIGAGNLFRGQALSEAGLSRISGDYMGMLGTMMNALALRDAFERKMARRTYCHVDVDRVLVDPDWLKVLAAFV